MPAERISEGPRKAQRVRSIVEAKENFVWATTMEDCATSLRWTISAHASPKK